MKRRIGIVFALLCTLSVPLGCTPQPQPAPTTTVTTLTATTTTKGTPSSTKRITTKSQKSSVTRAMHCAR
ncbi:MAG: hypothetical protein IJO59_01530 [Clostridia bacterium]|nr:hypothetical protein [Clostridia bacterium]